MFALPTKATKSTAASAPRRAVPAAGKAASESYVAYWMSQDKIDASAVAIRRMAEQAALCAAQMEEAAAAFRSATTDDELRAAASLAAQAYSDAVYATEF